MPSQYSPTLRLQLMNQGEKTGQWGNITNVNLGDLVEQALTYITLLTVSDVGDTTMTALDGLPDQSRSMMLRYQGTITANRNVICPQVGKFYVLQNNTTGGHSVTLKTAAVGSTGVTLPNGFTAIVMCDGTNVIAMGTYSPALGYSAITNSTIDSTSIGATTPSSGNFSTLTAQNGTFNGGTINGASVVTPSLTATGGTINGVTIGGITPAPVTSSSLVSTSGSLNNTAIGATTASTGRFTTLSSSGQYTNTVIAGTAPFVVTSTTKVENLYTNRASFSDAATITDDTSSNTTFYPIFVSTASGNQAVRTSSTKWTFTPSTGSMGITAATIGTLTLTNALGTANGGLGTTNGFLVPRVTAVASATTITANVDTTDILTQANTQAAGTLTIAAPTGTPTNGQKLVIRVTCTNAQTLSWNAAFRGSNDLALPAATTGSSKVDYVGFFYNSTALKWDLVAKVFGF